MQNPDSFKILVVDDDSDRKQRIAVLKGNGFTVFPALHLQQARERCRPGSYDLIVVNASGNPELACAWCDELRSKDPAQLVLVMDGSNLAPVRDYTISARPEALLERVKALLAGRGMAARLPAA